MNQRFILFSLIFLFCIAVISYRVTYALFSSSASNNGNVFSASTAFPTATPTPTVPITPTVAPTTCNQYCQQNSSSSLGCINNLNKCQTDLFGTFGRETISPCFSGQTKFCCCK